MMSEAGLSLLLIAAALSILPFARPSMRLRAAFALWQWHRGCASALLSSA